MKDPYIIFKKKLYPLEIVIIKHNPYGLPIGKKFAARRKEGDGSPFPWEISGDRIYQMREVEVKEVE
jgi:hypothetical protein